MSIGLAALLGVALLGAADVPLRWGDHGHRISGRAAAERLPLEMPEFFRAAAAGLSYLNPEPDRWRSAEFPEMHAAFRYDHFINLERVPAAVWSAPDRFAFLEALQRTGMARPAEAGLLPFVIVELQQRLTTGFQRWRRVLDAREREWVQQRIIQDAGILGHYVADAANPHHTSVHFDGWAEGHPNPRRYTGERGIHERFEGSFVAAQVTLEDVVAGTRAAARHVVDVRGETMAYLRRSHRELERLYALDLEASFGPENRLPAHRSFAIERLAAGATMLRDLWWSAWLNSAGG